MILGQETDPTLRKSYQYLRVSMIGLVLCLGVAVVHQSVRQGSILSSISAYYYTPAQTIFVGALIAIGVCLIAIKGADREDALLNIAGMLAPVVAVVPTARGADYAAAVAACKESDGASTADQALTAVDCPTVRALEDAAAANIENNMVALLVVGLVGLAAAAVFARWERFPAARFWPGFLIALAVFVLAATVFFLYRDTFINWAHYAAAIPMFACIVLVVGINALRRQDEQLSGRYGPDPSVNKVLRGLFPSRDGYAVVALAMLVAVVLGGALAWAGTFEDTIFWLEASLILLFAAFWAIQTTEQWQRAHPPREASVRTTELR